MPPNEFLPSFVPSRGDVYEHNRSGWIMRAFAIHARSEVYFVSVL